MASRTSVILFRSLSHRPFALLWGGQTISRLGDSLCSIALAWWVLQQTGSAASCRCDCAQDGADRPGRAPFP